MADLFGMAMWRWCNFSESGINMWKRTPGAFRQMGARGSGWSGGLFDGTATQHSLNDKV